MRKQKIIIIVEYQSQQIPIILSVRTMHVPTLRSRELENKASNKNEVSFNITIELTREHTFKFTRTKCSSKYHESEEDECVCL